MKKWLGALFAFMLVIGVLAACGPDDEVEESSGSDDAADVEDAGKPEKLLVWEDDNKGAALEDAAEKFEEEYGIEIEYQEYNITEIEENLASDGNTDAAPDVVTLPHDRIGSTVVKGYISPIEVGDDVLDQITKSSETGRA